MSLLFTLLRSYPVLYIALLVLVAATFRLSLSASRQLDRVYRLGRVFWFVSILNLVAALTGLLFVAKASPLGVGLVEWTPLFGLGALFLSIPVAALATALRPVEPKNDLTRARDLYFAFSMLFQGLCFALSFFMMYFLASL